MRCPADDRPMTDKQTAFEEHRRLLEGAAYRILGTRTDAEDVVQEAWIRWSTVEPDTVDDARAYLVTITSRLALNKLRELKARRETYVGPWLPEPVATATDDPARAAELADEVSMAMLIVLESLTPLERAAFVMTDVFAMKSPEVAEALGRSPASVRQLVTRARSHLAARTPRQVVEKSRHRAVIERFLNAAMSGDMAAARRRPLPRRHARHRRRRRPASCSAPDPLLRQGDPLDPRGPPGFRRGQPRPRDPDAQRRTCSRGAGTSRRRLRLLPDGGGWTDHRGALDPQPGEAHSCLTRCAEDLPQEVSASMAAAVARTFLAVSTWRFSMSRPFRVATPFPSPGPPRTPR